MARRDACGREMLDADGCDVERVIVADGAYERIRRGRGRGPCGDCGARPGHLHHPGCDLEPCPRCRRQLLSCGCDPIWEDEVRWLP